MHVDFTFGNQAFSERLSSSEKWILKNGRKYIYIE